MSIIIQQIESFIDRFGHLWPNYVIEKSSRIEVLNIIRRIAEDSDKEPVEAFLSFFSAIRYIINDKNALAILEQNDSFLSFLNDHAEKITDLAVNNKVQGNFLERAFPVLELINSIKSDKPTMVIELGASCGLIGKGLLFADEIIEKKDLFLRNTQQLPKYCACVERYHGFELQIPERRWFLSCIHDPENVDRLARQLDHFNGSSRFSIEQANAIGFSQRFGRDVLNEYTLIILTSFMLYQLDTSTSGRLSNEIETFLAVNGGHWINQTVDMSKPDAYYVEIDGSRVIQMADDSCSSWKKCGMG